MKQKIGVMLQSMTAKVAMFIIGFSATFQSVMAQVENGAKLTIDQIGLIPIVVWVASIGLGVSSAMGMSAIGAKINAGDSKEPPAG